MSAADVEVDEELGARLVEIRTRLADPEAFLSRGDLAALGLPRRAVDAIFRQAPKHGGTVHLAGYARPLLQVRVYRLVLAASTYAGDRVRP